jgi:Phage capsid family
LPLLDDLRQRRTAAREAADQILTRAAEEQRDLAADELATCQGHVVEQREADDAIEQEHERLLAEARAASRAGRGPTLSRQALDTARAFRSAIYAKNPAPIEVYSDLPDESDTTLSTVTLKAFKYANYFEISQELANHTPTNLLDFLARQAALSLGLGATGYGNDLINGVGTTAPRGLLLDAATGVTGPAGTGTTRTPTSGCCSSAPTTRRSPRNGCTSTWRPTMLRPRSNAWRRSARPAMTTSKSAALTSGCCATPGATSSACSNRTSQSCSPGADHGPPKALSRSASPACSSS